MDKELQIEQGPFTIEDLEIILRKTKTNKTAGFDEIPAEVCKKGHFNHIYLELCNDVYTLRNQLNTGRCNLPLPKKGYLTVTDNYRGITLTYTAAKLYNTQLI